MISPRDRTALTPAAPLLLVAMLTASACSKPWASAPTEDFVRRHACPASRVETTKEGSDRARVTGCGDSEVYVRDCANRSSSFPGKPEPRAPLTESEARGLGSGNTGPAETGCAWTREQERPGADFRPGGRPPP